jgi:phosphoribosyl-ATP pyrophosphohydrolase/phosphoribosyl-AMP cyclohydrolase
MVDKIDWEKQGGLIPVIAQEDKTNQVLMLAYMDNEALNLPLDTNIAHYFSRSKNRIWKKGETSGHIQSVVSIMLDCDKDTILLKVIQKGVACHTGRKTCFFTDIKTSKITSDIEVDTTATYGVIDTLYHTIQDRKDGDTTKSWTAKLLQGKQNSLLKKIVEEASEFTFAIKDDEKQEIIYECADLVYHTLVALASKNISPDQIKQELKKRFDLSGIKEKNSREKNV